MDATLEIRQLGYKNPIVGFTGDVTDEDVKKFIEKGVFAAASSQQIPKFDTI